MKTLGHVRWHHRWELHRDSRVHLGPQFAKISGAGIASNAADGILFAALPLVVAQLTRDPLLVALAALVHGLPWLLFELISGEIVDRTDRRLLMAGGNVARAAGMLVLAVLVATDTVTLGALYAIAFGIGVAETLVDTSWEAIVPRLVSVDDLEVANSRTQANEWTANDLLGPPFGGFLFAAAAAAPFFLNTGAYVLAALLVAAIPGTFRTGREVAHGRGSMRRDIGEGIAWLWHHRVLRALSLTAGASNLVSTAMMSVFVLYSQEILDLSDVGFGVVLSAIGVGGIAGAATAHRVEQRLGPGTLLLASMSGLCLSALTVAVTSSPWVVAGAFLLDGVLVGSWNVVVVSLRQELTPDDLRGRVASDARTLAFGAIPLGALLGGVLAEVVSLRTPYMVAAVVYAVSVALMARVISNSTIAELRAATGVDE
jgi:MFS family permease